MPVYEYRCDKCGHCMEVLVKSSNAPRPVCEKCGSKELTRQFSTFSPAIKTPEPPAGCSGCCDGSCPHAGH
jgi:putative FmdB family regulatory protein